MKKIIALLLALLLVASMTACGEDATPTNPAAVITKATQPAASEDPTEPAATEPSIPASYVFVAEGEELVMGASFDGTQLSAANNVVELPSCAIDGTDIIYTYDNYEITASDEGNGAYLTAILLLNEGATPEGVKIGDEESKIAATYGEDCESDGVQYTYEAEGTQLIFLVQDGVIVTIEYRLAA